MNATFGSAAKEIRDLRLEKVKIGDIVTDVEIENNDDIGHFILRFGCGYTIAIDKRGINLQRTVLRPTHDHCNIEQLRKHTITKELRWCDTDHLNEYYEIARIEFGPITVEW